MIPNSMVLCIMKKMSEENTKHIDLVQNVNNFIPYEELQNRAAQAAQAALVPFSLQGSPESEYLLTLPL